MVAIKKTFAEKVKNFPFRSDSWTNRFLHEVLPDGSWKGKPCYIIGGGPSLKYNFDWNLLKGKRVISVNRAFERMDPTIIFSMDTRYLRWILQDKYGEEVRKKFLKSNAYKCWLVTYRASLPDYIYLLKTWKSYREGFRAFPESMKEGIGHGNNSGYGALNLAVCLKANPIFLLGFDMKHTEEDTHWHDGHPIPQRPKVLQNFNKFFSLLPGKLKELGINVINVTSDSDLNCFPKRTIKEVFHDSPRKSVGRDHRVF